MARRAMEPIWPFKLLPRTCHGIFCVCQLLQYTWKSYLCSMCWRKGIKHMFFTFWPKLPNASLTSLCFEFTLGCQSQPLLSLAMARCHCHCPCFSCTIFSPWHPRRLPNYHLWGRPPTIYSKSWEDVLKSYEHFGKIHLDHFKKTKLYF